MLSPVPEPPVEITNTDLSVYEGLDPNKPFSPDALRAHIDRYLLPLGHHLLDECSTLKPEYMEKVGEKAAKRIDVETETYLRQYDPSWFLCGFVGEY